MIQHPDEVRGHQLERLRIRLLASMTRQHKSQRVGRVHGGRMTQYSTSLHKTPQACKVRTCLRIKRFLKKWMETK